MTDSTNEVNGGNWFHQAYHPIGFWSIGLGHRTYLGDETHIRDKSRRVCRFCGQTMPAVTFNKDAHVAPQMLAARSLLSVYECDVCNESFGIGIENDLGIWTKPYRTVLRVPGQKGVPTIIGVGPDPWRIEGGGTTLKVNARRDAMPYEVDEEKHLIIMELLRDPYTPAGVMKAFVRIGLTLMPEDELVNFPKLMAWIRNPDHKASHIGTWSWVYETTFPGPMPNDHVRAGLFRRKSEEGLYPYMFLMLAYANHAYQVPLFSVERDAHLDEKRFEAPLYPHTSPTYRAAFGHPVESLIDLTGTELVQGETVKIKLSYDAREEVTDVNPVV
jgi:hypothetical protein